MSKRLDTYPFNTLFNEKETVLQGFFKSLMDLFLILQTSILFCSIWSLLNWITCYAGFHVKPLMVELIYPMIS